jgi:hypothetical protein
MIGYLLRSEGRLVRLGLRMSGRTDTRRGPAHCPETKIVLED